MKKLAFLLLLLLAFSGCDFMSSPKKLHISNGRDLYIKLCSGCHQEDGSGIARLYPPVLGTNYMLSDSVRTLNIIYHGKAGKMIVNGLDYNGAMPAYTMLTETELAYLMTYLFNSKGREGGFMDAAWVKKNLKPAPYSDESTQ